MFHKNLRYYRLKKGMSINELASVVGMTPELLSDYESGEKKPSMEVIENLAKALNIRVSDFLRYWDDSLKFKHGDFIESNRLSEIQQEYIIASIEEYMSRFFAVLDIVGNEVLPEAPESRSVVLHDNPEENALSMREYLRIAHTGPVGNLVALLENKGFLICFCDVDNNAFSELTGQVNNRPYIAVNQNMAPERIRATLAYELALFLFNWPEEMNEKEIEEMATAINDVFLKGSNVSNTVCIAEEKPTLFLQLVLQAVNENKITIQKGAELLQLPYSVVADQCFAVVG